MNCPKCRERLRKESFRKRDYLICFHCEGVWISGANLDAEGLGHLGILSVSPTQFPCPSCETPMDETTADDVLLEHCRRCNGIFFDQGELEKAYPGYMNADLQGFKTDAIELARFLAEISRFVSAVRSAMSALP